MDIRVFVGLSIGLLIVFLAVLELKFKAVSEPKKFLHKLMSFVSTFDVLSRLILGFTIAITIFNIVSGFEFYQESKRTGSCEWVKSVDGVSWSTKCKKYLQPAPVIYIKNGVVAKTLLILVSGTVILYILNFDKKPPK
ncbi:MAG: hypothetical protein AAB656_04705 [Patescibacteria group bacterium]